MNLNFQTGIKLVLLSKKTDVNLKNIVSNSVGCCTQQTAVKVKPVSKSKLSTTIMVLYIIYLGLLCQLNISTLKQALTDSPTEEVI